MSRAFNHCLEILGITLSVSGTYHPAEATRFDDPPDTSLIEVERVSVSGSDINIQPILCDYTNRRIEEAIERIEAGN